MDRNEFSEVPDELWALVEPLLPPEPPKPRGGRGRVAARKVFAGILFRLRTGCQWKAIPRELADGGTCHRRFTEWTAAGAFEAIFRELLRTYDREHGLSWLWCSMDSATVKAPKGATKLGRIRPTAPSPAPSAMS